MLVYLEKDSDYINKKVLVNHIISLDKRIVICLAAPVMVSLAVVWCAYEESVVAFGYIYKNRNSFPLSEYFANNVLKIKVFCALYLFIATFIIPLQAYQWLKKGLAGNAREIARTLAYSLMAVPAVTLLLIYVISGFIGYRTEFFHIEITNKLALSSSLLLINFFARYLLAVFGAINTIRHLLSVLILLSIFAVWLWPVWFMALAVFVACLYLAFLYLDFRKKIGQRKKQFV